MTSHWPTYADGMFWCACDNRTYTTEELWLSHAALAWLEEQLNPPGKLDLSRFADPGDVPPVEMAGRSRHQGS